MTKVLKEQSVVSADQVFRLTNIDILEVKSILEDMYDSGRVRRIFTKKGRKIVGVKYQWIEENGNK